MTKEAKIYNEEYIASSISGARQDGKLHAKGSNWTNISQGIQK